MQRVSPNSMVGHLGAVVDRRLSVDPTPPDRLFHLSSLNNTSATQPRFTAVVVDRTRPPHPPPPATRRSEGSRASLRVTIATVMHDLAQTIEILERTPATLRGLLLGASDFWTRGNYGEGTWSAYQVLGHLIVGERDDWMPRLRRILEHGESRPFDPFPHDATVAADANTPLADLLKEFQGLRTRNLDDLRALKLTPADLDRTGTHPALGRVTAAELLATWAAHDLHHIRQACLAMAWQYRDEVGPWRGYLNTLAT